MSKITEQLDIPISCIARILLSLLPLHTNKLTDYNAIQANDESLRDVSHDEAIRVLKASPNLLDLLVEPAQLEFNVSLM